MQTVYLVRHGETDHNIQGRWQGYLDVALNEEGRRQAKLLAQRLEETHFHAIYSSDLQRAADTAKMIAATRMQSVVHFDERLREVNLGVFQGLTREQLKQHFPDELARWNTDPHFVVPEGESRMQIQARSFAAFTEITAKHADQQILFVTHGGTLRLLLQRVLNVEDSHHLRFANTSVTILQRSLVGSWELHTLNDVAHLNGGHAAAQGITDVDGNING